MSRLHAVAIAPNTWGFFEKQLNSSVSSNIIAVIGNESVLVYDAGHHPLVTRQVIADIRRRTNKPVRYLVISHWRNDHGVGRPSLRRRGRMCRSLRTASPRP